jgi:hypothetical protein
MPDKPTASREVKEFLRKIGSKGGKISSQNPRRKTLNRDAANARWRKLHPVPKKVEETED